MSKRPFRKWKNLLSLIVDKMSRRPHRPKPILHQIEQFGSVELRYKNPFLLDRFDFLHLHTELQFLQKRHQVDQNIGAKLFARVLCIFSGQFQQRLLNHRTVRRQLHVEVVFVALDMLELVLR